MFLHLLLAILALGWGVNDRIRKKFDTTTAPV